MSALPDSRRALYGRTYSSPWSASNMDPIQCYPRASSRIVNAAYAVVCLASCVLIGWLLAQGV